MNCIEMIAKNNVPAELAGKDLDKKAVRYFYPAGGCLGKLLMKGYSKEGMKARVDEFLFNKINEGKALEKAGLDPEEVKEIPSFSIGGWSSYKHSGHSLWRDGISADYDITYFFFSGAEMTSVNYSLNLLNGKLSAKEESVFYKDINKVVVEESENGAKSLVIASFGEKMSFALENESEKVNSSIAALKAKVREIKSR